VVTREPGGTELGRQLRAILLNADAAPLEPFAELLLYAADRAQHVFEVIDPGLVRGATVLCDRFLDATIAYQGLGRGLGAERVLELHRHPPLDRRPDRTILLDLDIEVALRRARGRDRARGMATHEGRFEAEHIEFHERVRSGYLELARDEPGRIKIVDASGDPTEIESRVDAALADLGLPGLGPAC
jgi:dTMP kinase